MAGVEANAKTPMSAAAAILDTAFASPRSWLVIVLVILHAAEARREHFRRALAGQRIG
jgi:hypothetical protein